jgi:hypothetical protein
MRDQMGVCLTKKQEQFFKFVQNYHKEHGTFPSATQASKLLNKPSGSITSLYGSLFVKGAFTATGPLTDTAYERHSGGVRPFDVSKLKFNPKQTSRTSTLKHTTIVRKMSKDANLSEALVKLLRDSDSLQSILDRLSA